MVSWSHGLDLQHAVFGMLSFNGPVSKLPKDLRPKFRSKQGSLFNGTGDSVEQIQW